ncbi:CBS domain-containing protein [Streptomyces sp. NPDC032472]|uniref:CBS domain-containing protein n=1 Tax=Streptomyces sp. NPDC032472 TaxID=3155018 RepID=UPI0033F1DD1E
MAGGAECIGAQETVLVAAKKMTELGVGALPVCGTDDKLKGMLTDRDIVVKVLGAGKNSAGVRAGDLAQGEAVTMGADDDAQEILRTKREHKVRRLPVIDGHRLVGIVAQADAARACPIRRSATFMGGGGPPSSELPAGTCAESSTYAVI